MIDPALTATHEASHAVAANLLGVGVRRVMLLPSGGGSTLLDALREDDAQATKRALVILAAGDAGEAAYGPARRLVGWWSL